MKFECETDSETRRDGFNFKNMLFVAIEIEYADPIAMFSKIGQDAKASSLIT